MYNVFALLGIVVLLFATMDAVAQKRPAHTCTEPTVAHSEYLFDKSAAGETGNQNWVGGFGLEGVNGTINVVVASGDRVYVGGMFGLAGGAPANNVAYWDGEEWHAMGTGTDIGIEGEVFDIAISGATVYVAGAFNKAGPLNVRNIAAWNSTSNNWSTLGQGVGSPTSGSVNAMQIIGNNLYVGGSFLVAGETVAANIARWDGTRWHKVGRGVNNAIKDLAAGDSGLYVAGAFTIVGTKEIGYLAHLELPSEEWTGFGIELTQHSDNVPAEPLINTVAVDDDYIYVGGSFLELKGIYANSIAQYSKATKEWLPMNNGLQRGSPVNIFGAPDVPADIRAITIAPDGVYVGGNFTLILNPAIFPPDTLQARQFAIWDGENWSAFKYRDAPCPPEPLECDSTIGSGVNYIDPNVFVPDTQVGQINSIAASPDGWLYIGGRFNIAGPYRPADSSYNTINANNICRFRPAYTWASLGNGIDAQIEAMAYDVDDESLYIGGQFTVAGTRFIARWDILTKQFYQFGSGPENRFPIPSAAVRGIATNATDVYIVGDLIGVGGTEARGIARWNKATQTWHAVGEIVGISYAIALQGDDILVGTNLGLLRWDGSTWQNEGNIIGSVYAIAVAGSTVYIGGNFTNAGGSGAKYIAGWNRETNQWLSLGNGADAPVHAIAMDTTADGRPLYVGGTFKTINGIPVKNIAVYYPDEGRWEPLAGGIDGPINTIVVGKDSNIYVGGTFQIVNGSTANGAAVWNAGTWQTMGDGVQTFITTGTVHAMIATDSGIYAGGNFRFAGGNRTNFLAEWLYKAPIFPTTSVPHIAANAGIALYQNSPNPFVESTTFQFTLATPQSIKLSLADSRGNVVATIAEGVFPSGNHTIRWNANQRETGMYFYTLRTTGSTITRKLIIAQ